MQHETPISSGFRVKFMDSIGTTSRCKLQIMTLDKMSRHMEYITRDLRKTT